MKHKFPKAMPEKKAIKLHTLIYDMTSAEYHSTKDTYSSSQLKDLMEDDEDIFIKKYITKEIEREESGAFDIGSYFHTMVLEPDKVGTDCVVFRGKVRRGHEWDKFKAKNKDKIIVTQSQMEVAERISDAVKNSPVAMNLISNSKPEVSVFVELTIQSGDVFSRKYNKVLGKNGWEDCDSVPPKGKGVDLVVKVRADALGEDFVLDLKSTTGNARSLVVAQDKIKYYTYDLSASLYLDIFNLPLGGRIKKFVWTFASKDCFNARSYEATEEMIQVGRAKWKKAILALAMVKKNNWESSDSMGSIGPSYGDLWYLKEKETDLL